MNTLGGVNGSAPSIVFTLFLDVRGLRHNKYAPEHRAMSTAYTQKCSLRLGGQPAKTVT